MKASIQPTANKPASQLVRDLFYSCPRREIVTNLRYTIVKIFTLIIFITIMELVFLVTILNTTWLDGFGLFQIASLIAGCPAKNKQLFALSLNPF